MLTEEQIKQLDAAGWAVVPKEANVLMQDAFHQWVNSLGPEDIVTSVGAWSAMLSATPTPPVATVSDKNLCATETPGRLIQPETTSECERCVGYGYIPIFVGEDVVDRVCPSCNNTQPADGTQMPGEVWAEHRKMNQYGGTFTTYPVADVYGTRYIRADLSPQPAKIDALAEAITAYVDELQNGGRALIGTQDVILALRLMAFPSLKLTEGK